MNFDFYNTLYKLGYLDKEDIKKATKWSCISMVQYKEIIGEEYTE